MHGADTRAGKMPTHTKERELQKPCIGCVRRDCKPGLFSAAATVAREVEATI